MHSFCLHGNETKMNIYIVNSMIKFAKMKDKTNIKKKSHKKTSVTFISLWLRFQF